MSHTLRQSPEPPDQDARLAELLDACLEAEHGAPGSAGEVVNQAPEELRNELDELVAVARALATAEWRMPSSQFRAGARARFEEAAQPAPRETGGRRVARWLVGLAAGLALLAVGGYGSVLASVGSLPGEPLYAVKQADEAVTLGLTRDDLSRALVLLRQAGIRLDEARRLLSAGRAEVAGELLQQYAATLERAGTSLNRATAVDPRARAEFQSQLQQQLGQLQSLAREAPQTLQPSIDRAEAAVSAQIGSDQTSSDPTSSGQNDAPSATATPAPSPVSPAVSPSPAASPSVRAPTQAPGQVPASASPSPVSTASAEDAPGK
jgi:Domain of unknown function (DUF5667)